MNKILYPFLFVFLILTGSVITMETANLDTSAWNFTGADMAKTLAPYSGFLFMVICCGVVIVVAMRKGK